MQGGTPNRVILGGEAEKFNSALYEYKIRKKGYAHEGCILKIEGSTGV